MRSRYGSHALAEGDRPGCRVAESVITPSVVAGFASAESVITSPVVAGFGSGPVDSSRPSQRDTRPPRRRTAIPAACRYSPAVSRRTFSSRSIRRSDHPSRPSASICSRFSSSKTLAIPAEGPRRPSPRQRLGPIRGGRFSGDHWWPLLGDHRGDRRLRIARNRRRPHRISRALSGGPARTEADRSRLRRLPCRNRARGAPGCGLFRPCLPSRRRRNGPVDIGRRHVARVFGLDDRDATETSTRRRLIRKASH